MQKYFIRLFGKELSIFLIILSCLLFIISLWHRNPHVDDAWIGEQAYWLNEVGYVKSELMRGINQQEIKNLVHHKFFNINGALAIKLFGYSLWTLKSVSFFWICIFLFYFVSYLKNKFSNFWLLGLAIFGMHSFIQEYSFVYRPEIMVMTFGFFSFVNIDKFIDSNDIKNRNLILSGLFAGLASVAHLNGLIFCMSGLAILLIKGKYKSMIWFAMSTFPTLMIYMYDITTLNDLVFWKNQFFQSPAIHGNSVFSIYRYLSKIFDEHQLFFHSPKEIAFTLLFINAILIIVKKENKNMTLYYYLGFLIVSLAIISMHNASRYTILYLPFMILTILNAINYMMKKGLYHKLYQSFAILLVTFFCIHFLYNIKIASNKFYTEKFRELSVKAIGQTTEQLNIIAPMEFIFDEIKYYNSIQSDLGYMDLVRAGKLNSTEDFLLLAEKNNIDFIIVNPVFDNFIKISQTMEIASNVPYKTWNKIEGYTILKLK